MTTERTSKMALLAIEKDSIDSAQLLACVDAFADAKSRRVFSLLSFSLIACVLSMVVLAKRIGHFMRAPFMETYTE